ncbi:hypothetical protein [Candidatus Tisiphia endosymbiont of Ceraclea dissimilis]|uniref:hypothetical protein n=1 Tax=Candidatus Tisiphia endosymbiont of Ceraclea dissimilis TaxID=3077928 RepID=UPI003CCB2B26
MPRQGALILQVKVLLWKMYQGDKADAIQYFELSKYLGDKLKLFEGYLSERSGLGVIKREEIEKDIANEDYEQATNKLNESVQLYQKLKSDNTIYKEGYKPGTGLQA